MDATKRIISPASWSIMTVQKRHSTVGIISPRASHFALTFISQEKFIIKPTVLLGELLITCAIYLTFDNFYTPPTATNPTVLNPHMNMQGPCRTHNTHSHPRGRKTSQRFAYLFQSDRVFGIQRIPYLEVWCFLGKSERTLTCIKNKIRQKNWQRSFIVAPMYVGTR